jgi:ribosomal biogenesis protein LAS1
MRDASLRSHYHQEIKTILKDVERWIAEATVAANVAVGELGWDSPEKADQSTKEKWALERLCDALMEKGALVPLSKKCLPSPPLHDTSQLTLHVQKTHVPHRCLLSAEILHRVMVPSTR